MIKLTADELFKELGYIKRENKKTGYVEYNQENKKQEKHVQYLLNHNLKQ